MISVVRLYTQLQYNNSQEEKTLTKFFLSLSF